MIASFVFQVVCTGKEERLLDCDFPEDFVDDYGSPESALEDDAPAPSSGLRSRLCDSDKDRLSVICRRFEITGEPYMTESAAP